MEEGKLRCGYTTGSCAAAAAKGSVLFLLGVPSETVAITLPGGESVTLPVAWQEWQQDGACTAIEKDGGDDPDVTSGLLVLVHARWEKSGITVQGGPGVGVVTKPGLAVPPGEAAINPVPRKMIQTAVQQVCPMGLGVKLTVSIPGGERIAQKTFNPRLGIVGGLSVLGTTGIVVPRSIEGFLGTIAAELSVLAHQGIDAVVLTPGNYGRQYARGKGFPEEMVVTYGNFLGFALERVLALKIERVHLIGELGKMVKVAGGIFLTDSRVADARMEILAAFAAFFGVRQTTVERILHSSLTEEVLEYLEGEGISLPEFGNFVAERVRKRVLEYTQGRIRVAVELFSLKRGFLGKAGESSW
jgi:cobalt-precorrin-5B (C1)-methyltransferase